MTSTHKISTHKSGRLESLDILRGFDLFCLVALEGIVHALSRAINAPWFQPITNAFTHAEWEGFSPWDIVMPLFMFMAGVTIPFTRSNASAKRLSTFYRIIKRVILLWLFGMMCQGNLLALDPSRIYIYSNTLQAIAIGYLVAALLYMVSSIRVQVFVAIVLLAAYWCGMEFVSIDGFGAGNYSPTANFAEWVDRICLGRYRDGATAGSNGEVIFAPWYNYTWIWSSLTFAVTVMTGVFAGQILKNSGKSKLEKTLLLTFGGAAMVIIGLVAANWQPIVKRIWTASMTILSSGICWLLMALFYYIIDCLGFRKGLGWLKVYGMNSIAAYMLLSCVNFNCVAESFLFGLQRYIGPWYDVLVAISSAALIYLILLLLYRHRIYLKV